MRTPASPSAATRLIALVAIGVLFGCGGSSPEPECNFTLYGGCLDGIGVGLPDFPRRTLVFENQTGLTVTHWEDGTPNDLLSWSGRLAFTPPLERGDTQSKTIADLPGLRARVQCESPNGLVSRSRAFELDGLSPDDLLVVQDEDLAGIFAACDITGLDLEAPPNGDGIRVRVSVTYDLGPAAVLFEGAYGVAALEFEFQFLDSMFPNPDTNFTGGWQGAGLTDDWTMDLDQVTGTVEVELSEQRYSGRAAAIRVRCLIRRHELGQANALLWPLWIRSNELALSH